MKLTPKRIKQLEEIGMEWLSPQQRGWQEVYAFVKDYYDTHGNLNIPYTLKMPNGINIWYWLNKQRKRYSEGKLDPERIALLNEIYIHWTSNSKVTA